MCWLLAAKPLSSGVWGRLGGKCEQSDKLWEKLQQGQLRTHGAVAELSLARSSGRGEWGREL